MHKAADVNFINFVTRGSHIRFMPPEETSGYEFSPQELDFLKRYEGSRAIGTPAQVEDQIMALQRRFGANEVMLVSNAYHLQDRLRSFELVASELGLNRAAALVASGP